MGQIVEQPEVITEGKDIEECRSMLKDALHQMVLAYGKLGKSIPQGSILYEQLSVDLADVRKTAWSRPIRGRKTVIDYYAKAGDIQYTPTEKLLFQLNGTGTLTGLQQMNFANKPD